MRIREIKKYAKERCKDNLRNLILITLIIMLFAMGLYGWYYNLKVLTTSIAFIFGLQIITDFCTSISFICITYCALKTSLGGTPEIEDIFYPFKHNFGELFRFVLRKTIVIALYSALFGVLGGFFGSFLYIPRTLSVAASSFFATLIVNLRYFPAMYLLLEGEEATSYDAVHRGLHIMQGNYKKLICFTLSFIPWLLLIILTLGIGSLIIGPWVQVALAAFYMNLKYTEKPVKPVQPYKRDI